jgi:WD40 repeat protein
VPARSLQERQFVFHLTYLSARVSINFMADDLEAFNLPGKPPIDSPPATPSLEDIKLQYEIDKLILENEKLRQEMSDAKRPYLLRNYQLLAAAIATLGTVIGLGVALREHYFDIENKIAQLEKREADETTTKAEGELATAKRTQAEAESRKAAATAEGETAKAAILQAKADEGQAQIEIRTANGEIETAHREVAGAQRAAEDATRQSDDAVHKARAQQLVAASLSSLQDDPELGLLLAMQAVTATWSHNHSILPEATNQLHNALLTSRLRRTIRRPGQITSVSWNPIDNRVASACGDGNVAIADAGTGAQLQLLSANEKPILSVAWSPDGRLLASGGEDQTARIWDAASGRQIMVFSVRTGPIRSLAWTPDGAWVALGSNQVILWGMHGQDTVMVDTANDGNYTLSLAWSRSGKYLAYGRTDRYVSVWDKDAKKIAFGLHGNDYVRAVAWNRNGSRLLTDNFFQATIWDTTTHKEVFSLPSPRSYVYGAAWSPDGSTIATAADTVTLWDAATGRKLQSLNGHTSHVRSVSWSPEGDRLLSGSEDHSVKIWTTAQFSSEVEMLSDESRNPEYNLAWSPDGRQIATVLGGLRVRRAQDGKDVFAAQSEDQYLRYLQWSPDGTRLIIGPVLTEINAMDGSPILRFPIADINMSAMSLSRDGKWLLTAHSLGEISVWNAATGKLDHNITCPPQFFKVIEWSPDGREFVTGSTDANVPDPLTGKPREYSNPTTVWDVMSGKPVVSFSDHAVQSASWSPDGKRIATAQDREIKIWDVLSGKQIETLVGHRDSVTSVSWSPDGKRIASASGDLTTRVWDAATGTEEISLPGHSLAVMKVAWSPDGKRLASAGTDGLTQIYAISTEELMRVARSRVTRSMTVDECRQYFHSDRCPVMAEF